MKKRWQKWKNRNVLTPKLKVMKLKNSLYKLSHEKVEKFDDYYVNFNVKLFFLFEAKN